MAPAQTDDLSHLAASIFTVDAWLVLLVVIAFEMLGGWAHHLGSPTDDSTTALAYLVLGAVAALGSLCVIAPGTDPIKLSPLSVVAGYAGKAVMTSLQARLQAATAKETAKRADEQKTEAIKAGKEATGLAKKIAEQARTERAGVKKHLLQAKGQPVNLVLPEIFPGIEDADNHLLLKTQESSGPQPLDQVAALDVTLDKLLHGIV